LAVLQALYHSELSFTIETVGTAVFDAELGNSIRDLADE
jgi:hypothetical protein